MVQNDRSFHDWEHSEQRLVAMALLATTVTTPTLLGFVCFVSGGTQCLLSAYFTPNVTSCPLFHSFSFHWCLRLLHSLMPRLFLNPLTHRLLISLLITTRTTSSLGLQTGKCWLLKYSSLLTS